MLRLSLPQGFSSCHHLFTCDHLFAYHHLFAYDHLTNKRYLTAFAILGTFIRFSIEYRQFEGPEEHVPARRAVEKVLNQSGLSTAFSFVKVVTPLIDLFR